MEIRLAMGGASYLATLNPEQRRAVEQASFLRPNRYN